LIARDTSPLKATAILSSGSILSIGLGLVSAKASALILGPTGMGSLALLQSALNLGLIITSMGANKGLVRAIARARAAEDVREEAALRGGAWLLCWGAGGLAMLLMTLMRAPLSQMMLGGREHAATIVLLAVALPLTVASALQVSILNGHHRVGELARVGVLSSLLAVATLLPLIWVWGERGIAWALTASSALALIVGTYYVRRRAPAPRMSPTLHERWASARSLLDFGVPFTASTLAGTGVQMALPVFVLHMLDASAVGFYRAATGVAVTYLGFLITTMGQDYYPRVSAVGDQPSVLVRLVNDQYRLVLLLAGPIVLGMLAVVPYLIPLIYSREFGPATDLLEWQLIGDLFRFPAWTMSFVILARSRSKVFFGTELVGGASLLLFSWLGMRWFGFEGLGGGFLLCTVVGYLLCWWVLRRSIRLQWTRENKTLFASLTLAACVIRALPHVGLEPLRTPVALALAIAAGSHSLYVFRAELRRLGTLIRPGLRSAP
jgi:O-antigen/teichoic acid export membrane protein